MFLKYHLSSLSILYGEKTSAACPYAHIHAYRGFSALGYDVRNNRMAWTFAHLWAKASIRSMWWWRGWFNSEGTRISSFQVCSTTRSTRNRRNPSWNTGFQGFGTMEQENTKKTFMRRTEGRGSTDTPIRTRIIYRDSLFCLFLRSMMGWVASWFLETSQNRLAPAWQVTVVTVLSKTSH